MKLKELRNEKNLTLNKLSEKINISPQVLSRYERGDREPDIKTLITLSDFFGVSVDYLIGRTDDFGVIKKAAELPTLTREETELLTYFKKLNNLQQQKVIGYCYALCH